MPDFQTLFGHPPTVRASAPGRVNLIGEHTDYNAGFVLPMAVPLATHVELHPRADPAVRVWSANVPEREGGAEYVLGSEAKGRGWLDYPQGVTRTLVHDGFAISGFDARVESTVPLGSGLSSSASLDVALLRALREAFGLPLDDLALARLGQRVENEFVGARVGIMDPMAASLGDDGVALFIDTRDLSYERVPLPPGLEVAVIDSGVSHGHAAGEYNTRRAECERACSLLGVAELRDLSNRDLPRLAGLPEPIDRRARHVVTENDRVLAAVRAIRANDLDGLGDLLYRSHESLRVDYEVTVPELDALVELARAEPGVYGARMTGGGFGGSVIVTTQAGFGGAVAARVARAYRSGTGKEARVLVPLA
jgi:galactokinase